MCAPLPLGGGLKGPVFPDLFSFGFPHLFSPQGSFLPCTLARKWAFSWTFSYLCHCSGARLHDWGLFLKHSHMRRGGHGALHTRFGPQRPLPPSSVRKEWFGSNFNASAASPRAAPDAGQLFSAASVPRAGPTCLMVSSRICCDRFVLFYGSRNEVRQKH